MPPMDRLQANWFLSPALEEICGFSLHRKRRVCH
jgi:hypothetical protein